MYIYIYVYLYKINRSILLYCYYFIHAQNIYINLLNIITKYYNEYIM